MNPENYLLELESSSINGIDIEKRLTQLELAINLTKLGEEAAKAFYYEKINPVQVPESEKPRYQPQWKRITLLRWKLSRMVPESEVLDFLKHNPHLQELWPSIQLTDEMKALAEMEDEIGIEVPNS
jgi:hypothetical protein